MKGRITYYLLVTILSLTQVAGCGEVIDISQRSEVTVHVGAMMVSHEDFHESVGIDTEYEISDPRIIELVDMEIAYANPRKVKAGMPGSDQASRNFFFQAKEKGTTELRLITSFRDEVTRVRIVRITVK